MNEFIVQSEQSEQPLTKPSRRRSKRYGVILTFLKPDTPPQNTLYLLVKGRHGGIWSFPKGHAKKEEEPLTTARREMEEETGIMLPPTHLPLSHRRLKGMVYFHFEGDTTHYTSTVQPTDSFEVEETRWTTLLEMETLQCNSGMKEFMKKEKKRLGF